MATLSLLSCNIIPRSCSNITNTVDNWAELDQKRKELYGEYFYKLNFTEISSFAKTDTSLLRKLGEVIFPDLKLLGVADKEAFVCNFFPRWILMESAIDYCTNYDYHMHLLESDRLDRMLVNFYGSSMSEATRLADEDIIKTFKPYWMHFFTDIADPVFRKKLDKVECIALFLLILFDDAYTNISDDGSRLCRNLQKVILRELRGYLFDNDCCEMRFLNKISTLLLLEKREQKFQEELLICGLSNVSLHDDFKAIMQVKKL